MDTPAKSRNPGNAVGRPRRPTVDQAILQAALELFIEHGVAGASIEKIARRAGVAKTSIYRRWSSREALLAQAIEVFRNATGYTTDLLDRTPPRDFVTLLIDACEIIARPDIRKMMARLVGSVPDYPMLIEVYRETYFLSRRSAFVRAFAASAGCRFAAKKHRSRDSGGHAQQRVDVPSAHAPRGREPGR